jgi:caffeoyl-CoA O-methyltransferase
MNPLSRFGTFFMAIVIAAGVSAAPALSQDAARKTEIDRKVKRFLQSHADDWVDWNVPEADGRVLYDLIIRNNYTKAVEIGTSTGHSAIWMAWALSQTGGKLITIEIDEGRYKKALANFKAAGLADHIDARLADAHELVKQLRGPFDLVFCDADKEWYKNYFAALAPKLEIGGCFTAHNVASRHWAGIREFLDHVQSLSNFKTTIIRSSPAGISVSCKEAE